MSDKDRRTSNVPRGASSSGTPTPSRDLPSRSGITALLSGDSGPVKTLSDARSWLDKKGWVLTGEQYDRSKMTNILFTVSLLPKLPPDAAAAIRAVALIIEDNIKDSLSSALSSAIADKFLARIGNVPDELTWAKEFLEATSTKQASTVVQLHEMATQHATTMTNLVEISTKLASTEASHLPAPPQWPSVQSSGPSPNSCPSSTHDPTASDSDIRIQQRLLLASCTVLIEIDHSHASSPTERTPQIALKICDDLNKRLCDLDAGNFGLVDCPGENTKIRGIQTLERGAYLFELNSPAAADRFHSYCVEFDLLTASLGVSVCVKDKAFNLVFRFVPCQSSFDPSDPDHISAIKTENGLDPGAISSASWLKKPERRSPNQNVASLKVTCSSPEAANHLLRERVYIAGHLYGHIHGACISDEKCAHCASSDHPPLIAAPTNVLNVSLVGPTPITRAPLALARPSKRNVLPSMLATPKTPCHTFPRANNGRGPTRLQNSPMPHLSYSLYFSPPLSPSPIPNCNPNPNPNPSLNTLGTMAGNRPPHATAKLPSPGPPLTPTPPQNVVKPPAPRPPPNE
ncbi:hypothetical protein PILCRDRAFT_15528 [Piloderma croceum F 1598]|uniref:Uncharacterized protein n=1 Tax=Piloderma croceum (strain F 1598) TaxID=765440 RepID=A0A0C3EKE2_PILCF|nr:hypothetical protein PILCRDRAFT_15528 [Piloderma croceum F 1598]